MAQIDSRLGDMIRSYREKLGLTQEEMAERLQVNLTHYGNIERAACNPSFSLFLRIAKELNLSVDAYLYSTRDLILWQSEEKEKSLDCMRHAQYFHNV